MSCPTTSMAPISPTGLEARNLRPTWLESTRIVAALADALAHAHSRLVVHRDVKPSNIIINSEHEPILVDFGLALDDSAGAQSGGSEKGLFSGTPSYMSPEQAAGTAHRIDGRTDIYGLGVVLYEMLTGHLPFRTRNIKELLRQLRDDEPQPPRQVARDIPPELEQACLKALAKQQQDRYTTAADFADDLRRVLSAGTEMPTVRQPLGEIPPPSAARRIAGFFPRVDWRRRLLRGGAPARPSAGRSRCWFVVAICLSRKRTSSALTPRISRKFCARFNRPASAR